ncbi:MAG: hypothetical protein KJO77_06560 [Bacteroidia bacterium]|nr:hypothetical protein [Bacteroidia bacterium]
MDFLTNLPAGRQGSALKITTGLDFLTKLRFENSPNKKTPKQAWRFFLLGYLFVTSAGFKPATS